MPHVTLYAEMTVAVRGARDDNCCRLLLQPTLEHSLDLEARHPTSNVLIDVLHVTRLCTDTLEARGYYGR
jgi:hypothetical protein